MLWRVSGLVTLFLFRIARALPHGDLGDLLGPELGGPIPVQTVHRAEQASASTFSHVGHVTSMFPELTTSVAQSPTSTIGTLLHLTLTTPSWLPKPVPEAVDSSTSISTTSTNQNTTSSTSYPSSSSPVEPPQGHAADWRVIGISVIVISVIGTTILAIMFFDQWWGFLCDVCGRRKERRKGGREELVPDWERGSWEFKVADNLPTYPSFGSPQLLRIYEGVEPYARSRRVGADQIPDQNVSLDGLVGHHPVPVLGGVKDTQGAPHGSSEQCMTLISPNNAADEMTVYTPRYTPDRSGTQKSTASEDAYDGLAAQ
ncbi:hypothetical protein B0F90DRAFT_95692 [Multifurca ochricompacta]|uniref:Uncharacterized protein n=1 Tax=Multifurca ochricompacta TaxID=376703 RepID=A0AAD4QTR0_9AGAM|nr:hypothetical protein B0F90DRAFT_95692 [Multifurca ochricompacta]